MSAHHAQPIRRTEPRLGRRLMRASLAAAGVALLVAGSIVNLFFYFWSRAALTEDMQVQARIMADNSIAPLVFLDRGAAGEALAALHVSPTVISAVLYDSQGARFASYGLPNADRQGRLVVDAPVRRDTQTLGHVELIVTLQPLTARAAVFAAITTVSALAALAMAYLLAVGIRRDIDRTEARLDEMAFLDPVTGLLNRHAADEHLQAMIRRAQRSGDGFALMLLDLDDFKLVNDTLGHEVGDDVLRQMAERLRTGLRARDLVFRFGGDEFIVVCEGPLREGSVERLGHAALQCLQEPLHIGRHEIYARGSVGIATFPNDAADAQALLRAADTAMYVAKGQGKNTFSVFEAQMSDQSHSRLRTATELRRAIARGELRLVYQPIVEIGSGTMVGVEALVRWQHPERGLLLPAEFIEVAESTGLVVDLGAWVLQHAARQLAAWQAAGVEGLYVAVNVSARQIKRSTLLGQVEEVFHETGVDPTRLEIEITEHTLVEDINANVQTLTALRDKGMHIAVDDFGTGLSSLAYLRRLPIDKFKIDRSFVSELPRTGEDVAIVTAIISMAHALGLRVVAEGVETQAQRELLTQLGCDFAQGFYFSEPMAAEALTALLYGEPDAVKAAGKRLR
jgi:diguanylate cyclase (GGDEF)-like protein